MKVLILLSAFISVTAAADPISARAFQSSVALENVLGSHDFPTIPSENAKRPLRAESLDSMYTSAFSRLPMLEQFGIQLKGSSQGNVNMDTERKFILLDPEFAILFVNFKPETTSKPIGLYMLMAHESSHYILDLYKLRNPGISFQDADQEHACVDLIALEILKRSGFSKTQVSAIAEAYLYALKSFSDALSGVLDPSSDITVRSAAVRWWLNSSL